MKKLFFLMIFTLPLFLQAQQKKASISIFSENGYLFYLSLNGKKQNDDPQKNIRIENVPGSVYNAVITFTDTSMKPISKNNIQVTNTAGTMMNVTYKIYKDRSGKIRLEYVTGIPVDQGYITSAGVTIYHFGNPSPVPSSIIEKKSDKNSKTDKASEEVKPPVPVMSFASNDEQSEQAASAVKEINCDGTEMETSAFELAVEKIKTADSEESRLTTASNILASNCFSTEQVTKIVAVFKEEESKLQFAMDAYKHTVDKKNYSKLRELFSISSNKEKFEKFLNENKEE